ncbi:MAG: NADH-quinone oxidoreductase subunit N, partial [Roseibium sp.]|nr:NADH-quinone oxidoreductase subunit N [Roseibium sp.]
MSELTLLPDLKPVLPEIILALGAMVLLMIGAFGGKRVSYAVFGGAMGLLGGTFLVLLFVPAFGETFGGSFVLDDFAYLLKLLVLAGSFFAIAMSWAYAKSQSFDHFEYPILIVLATLGMMLMLS